MIHSIDNIHIATLVLLALGGSMAGCARPHRVTVVDEYPLQSSSHQSNIRIDSIILHRSAGLGPGPNYSVIFTRDGRAEYRGSPSLSSRHVTSFAGREGVYEGAIEVQEFNALAHVMQSLGLMERPPPYPPLVDAAATEVIVVASGDRITHRGHVHDPPEVWLIGEAIDGIVEKITWRDVSAR